MLFQLFDKIPTTTCCRTELLVIIYIIPTQTICIQVALDALNQSIKSRFRKMIVLKVSCDTYTNAMFILPQGVRTLTIKTPSLADTTILQDYKVIADAIPSTCLVPLIYLINSSMHRTGTMMHNDFINATFTLSHFVCPLQYRLQELRELQADLQ